MKSLILAFVCAAVALPLMNTATCAQGCAPACRENLVRCRNACDGMSGCIRQCEANYSGCMSGCR